MLNDTCYAGYVKVKDVTLVTRKSRAQPVWRALYEPRETNAAFCAKHETSKEGETMGRKNNAVNTIRYFIFFSPFPLSRA